MDQPHAPTHRELGRLTLDMLTTGASPLIRLEGELDAASAPALIATFEDLVHEGAGAVVVDCGALRFCDSSGLRALIVAQGMLDDGNKVSLVRTTDQFRELLTITGLERIFEVS